ncbi:MAG: hypothetical protein UT14_C0002G0024 [Candidatus Shapirobacteria bacterium GW2011_GWE1_38_92]|nr:MAG: hypothetical protein US90_C0003G0021 [Candidatus Shapirobacteria bacterium GW2011_GWE2_38_30]KKQ92840.1 MAG: hypothetical protein UT14_C0002G0024 [Candidatus Shapirobacteria bacterium GW2011_GWE1_38_92]
MQLLELLPKTIQLDYIDKLWSYPDPIHLEKMIGKSNFNSHIVRLYLKSLGEDVLDDNPKEALTLLNKINSTNKIILFRRAYLLARLGESEKAKEEIKKINFKDKEIFIKCLNKISGSFTYTKILKNISKKYGVHEHFGYLETLIRENKYKLGVEVGVFMGFHSEHMLESCRNIKLVCVDLYDNLKGNGYDDWDRQRFDSLYNSVKKRLEIYKRVEFIRMISSEACERFKFKSIDFVYIDADHRYEGVVSDLLLWGPKVKDGGMVSGHDYGQKDWPGVKVAVDEWVAKNKYKLNRGEGGVWWVRL